MAPALRASLQPHIDVYEAYEAVRKHINDCLTATTAQRQARYSHRSNPATPNAHPVRRPDYPEWRRKTEHLITTAHAALNSPDRFHRLYIKLHPRAATILEEQLHSLETALATDEQQAQTIKPPTTEERRDQRRPDLEEDNDFDIHM